MASRTGGAEPRLGARLRDRIRGALPLGGRRVALLRRFTAGALLLTAVALALPLAPASGPRGEPVLTAAHELDPGTELAASDLAVRRMPRELVPEGALRDRERVVGEVLAHAVRDGVPLTDLSLLDDTLARVTAGDDDRAAVVLRPAESAIAELLRPGARVDIVTERDGRAAVLAERAAVVATHPPEASGEHTALVVVGLDRARAAKVASAKLSGPLTLTLR
ncbi:Flp pilus assembly protein CpaB [Actinopolyspora biskrensis]|uniref:Flp pilus assembly protein CpaB n=1 Tax=Actinopolyspora biskrensis TaxID=1470178 RepID=A0A852YZX0_9ACTN|nr:SAF domain-containing protein [Actinopolyspora biskrensis]NYH79292.1 Flp pilus assembly protein CpaB [Actinopolyspora biskrensis]